MPADRLTSPSWRSPGHSSPEITAPSYISVKTIETNSARIYRKPSHPAEATGHGTASTYPPPELRYDGGSAQDKHPLLGRDRPLPEPTEDEDLTEKRKVGSSILPLTTHSGERGKALSPA
jgi:hypothetical protein